MLKHYFTDLLLQCIKVVNDDTNNQVECEERTKDDKCHKIKVHKEVVLKAWLLIHLS